MEKQNETPEYISVAEKEAKELAALEIRLLDSLYAQIKGILK